MNPTDPCPCQSGHSYSECCQVFHSQHRLPETAEALMRSRYCAFALHNIDYIIATTVPAQQPLLNGNDLLQWSHETQWLGLTVLQHLPNVGKIHAQVEFKAKFNTAEGLQYHCELSAFVQIAQRWYFIDPTVALPTMKQACICGSSKKFKHCCGSLLHS